jgi:hypothetical protein
MEIVRIERDTERDCWTATVRSGVTVVVLDTENGSGLSPPLDERGRRREALPAVARALQKALPTAA